MKTKIAVTTSTFGEFDRSPLEMLEKAGVEAILNPFQRKLTAEEICGLLNDCIGVVAGTEKYSGDVLEKLRGLKVISRCGTGVDNIDMGVARKLGIDIYNTPNAPTAAVAELTLGLILGMLRDISVSDKEFKEGKWNKRMGYLLSGKRVGIIGLGRIGRMVASLCGAFNCEIAYYDIVPEKSSEAFKKMELPELLLWADIVTLHCAPPLDRKPLLNSARLLAMKKGAWLVNAARAELVDEQALLEALKSGHLSGAALDVFSKEPYSGPLAGCANVILTPHIGSYARESRVNMEREAVENLIKGLKKAGKL